MRSAPGSGFVPRENPRGSVRALKQLDRVIRRFRADVSKPGRLHLQLRFQMNQRSALVFVLAEKTNQSIKIVFLMLPVTREAGRSSFVGPANGFPSVADSA